jgi:hypothetical protein
MPLDLNPLLQAPELDLQALELALVPFLLERLLGHGARGSVTSALIKETQRNVAVQVYGVCGLAGRSHLAFRQTVANRKRPTLQRH